jgi:transglutaminase-like putative cysteine protease
MKATTIIAALLLCYPPAAPARERGDLNALLFYDDTHFTILNGRDSRLTRKYKALVLNRHGEEHATLELFYNPFHKITSMKATVTDVNGKLLKRHGLRDGHDYQYGISQTASDTRMKRWEMGHHHYPYVIEVAYQEEYKGSLFYPLWSPVPGEKQAVERATFTVSDPSNLGVRYRHLNIADPLKEAEGAGFRYTWQVEKLTPYLLEPFARVSALLPVVYIAPVNFEIDGYKGNMETWENFGRWAARLMEGKNDLPPARVDEVRRLCEGLPTTREKVKAIYRHVQQTTRYTSIQLGIGGWQPFPASFVHQKKHGDCKALSCYTHALLEAAGIPSFYTLIRAGEHAEPLPPDFSSAHFNHAIVTVPVEGDTLWLECTSQTAPFGFLGTFTSDRHALMITPAGGRLVRTRAYPASDNLRVTRARLEITPGGDAALRLEREITGLELEKEGFLDALAGSEKERREWLQDDALPGNLELREFRFLPLEGDECPRSGYRVEGTLKGFCPPAGGRLFITPFPFTTAGEIRLPGERRAFPVEIRYPYTRVDTIATRLPEGYTLETPLEPVTLEGPYGEYSTRFSRHGEELRFVRRFVLRAGIYPPSEYTAFKTFIDQVQSRDRARVVVKRDNN